MYISTEVYEDIHNLLEDCVMQHPDGSWVCFSCGAKSGSHTSVHDFEVHLYECNYIRVKLGLEGEDVEEMWSDLLYEEEL